MQLPKYQMRENESIFTVTFLVYCHLFFHCPVLKRTAAVGTNEAAGRALTLKASTSSWQTCGHLLLQRNGCLQHLLDLFLFFVCHHRGSGFISNLPLCSLLILRPGNPLPPRLHSRPQGPCWLSEVQQPSSSHIVLSAFLGAQSRGDSTPSEGVGDRVKDSKEGLTRLMAINKTTVDAGEMEYRLARHGG